MVSCIIPTFKSFFLFIVIFSLTSRKQFLNAESIPNINADLTLEIPGSETFGACANALSCTDCARSAKAMLQTSNGQYTCLWKLTSKPLSSGHNEDNNGQINPLQSEMDVNLNLRSSSKETTKIETIVTCDLIPFSNEVISKQAIPCSIDPNSLSTSMMNNQQSSSNYKRRTIKTFHWIGSIFIVMVFFIGLFRVRAVVLGKPFIPQIVTKLSMPRSNSKIPNISAPSVSKSYTPTLIPKRKNEISIRQHSNNHASNKGLSEKNIQETMLALRSRSRGPNA